ncbi:MAG TPA: hypothetical protein VGH80_00225 [Xanthomonadaceae bacterium]|jgi:hypothetical protein
MHRFRLQPVLTTLAFVLASAVPLQAGAQAAPDVAAPAAAPDSNLFATYTFDSTYTTAGVLVCGSVPGSDGCYGSGTMGTFGRIGALVEGGPTVNTTTNTVTRLVFVIDQAVGGGSGVSLVVYRLTEAIAAPDATISVTKVKTISLPQLTGGATAKTFLAANAKFLFVGTDQGTNAVRIAKSGYAQQSFGGFSPPIDVSAITADKYGFVTVAYGTTAASSGFYTFDPNGAVTESGGGTEYMLNTTAGLLTSGTSAGTSATPAQRLGVRYHRTK